MSKKKDLRSEACYKTRPLKFINFQNDINNLHTFVENENLKIPFDETSAKKENQNLKIPFDEKSKKNIKLNENIKKVKKCKKPTK